MADDVIGSVKVRIRPDTTKFAQDAKRDLERIEKRLPKLKVEANLDYRSLKSEALKALRTLNAELKGNERYKVQFRAAISEAGMKSAVKDAARKLNALAKSETVYIRAEALATKVEAELDKASLSEMNAQLNAYIKTISPKRVPIVPVLVPGSTTVVDKRLDYLARPRKAEIVASADFKGLTAMGSALAAISGLRLTGGIFREFREFFTTLDKKIPLIGSMALALAGLAGTALSVSGSIFALSRALAQIGPGAVALPGIFGGIAIGLAATVAVFKDFNKVLPDVADRLGEIQDSMSEKFWERAKAPISDMINNLLPKFAKGLDATSVALGTFFGNLAASLSSELGGDAITNMFADLALSIREFSKYTGSIAEIVRILGEAGAGQLPALAGWLGKVTEQFATFLSKAEEAGQIDVWISTAIDRIQSLGRVLANGAKLFAGLARAADAASPGDALTNLANALGRAEQVVNGSTFQAQMTGVLRASSEMMDNISQRSGPAFQAFWNTFATTLQTILPKAGEALGTLFDGVYSMLGSPAVQSGLISLFDGIAAGVEGLRPAFDALGPKLGAVMTLIGQMAATFGSVLGTIVQQTAPMAQALAEALTPLVAQAGPIISKIFSDLGPIFAVLGSNITKLGAALGPLLSAFSNLWNVIGPLLVPVLKIVVSILGSALVAVVQGVTLAINGIVQVIQGVISVFKGFANVIAGIFTGDMSRIMQGFRQIFSGLWGIVVGVLKTVVGAIWAWLNGTLFAIFRGGLLKLLTAWRGGWTKVRELASNALKSVRNVLVGAWNFIKGIFKGGTGTIKLLWGALWTAVKFYITTGLNVVRSVASGAIAFLKGIFRAGMALIKGDFSGAWAAISGAVGKAFTSIKNAAGTGITAVVSKVKELPSKALTAVAGIGSILLNAGKDLIQGFIDGIASMFGNVQGKLGELTDKLTSWKGPPKRDRILLYDAGRLILDGFIRGLESRFGKVKKLLNGLTADIPKNASKHLRNTVIKSRKELLNLLGQYDKIGAQIKAKIASIHQMGAELAGRVAEAVKGVGSLSSIDAEDITFEAITQHMADAIDKAKRFVDVLKSLRGLNLNSDMFMQIAEAGPSSLAYAEAIAAAGQAGVDALNKQQAELNKLAQQAGEQAKQEYIENGMAAAQGFIDGLKKKRKEIVAEMREIARELVKTIKQELNIKSPSRVFRQIGAYTGEGFVLGVKDTKRDAEKAIRGLSQGRPSAPNVSRSVMTGSSSTVNRTVNYYAAPGSPQVSGEESLFAALTRARSNGF